ncbi:MAG TPA: TonB-dependent receptor [Balneolales bacterium]|nr:TonB-dependent receptor [Balneolales bacterium]
MRKEVTGSRVVMNRLGKVTCLFMVSFAIGVFPAMARSGKAASLHNTITTVAQNSVHGKVTDQQTGDPLPGANVYIKGTTIGVSTDANGHYSLDVPSLSDTLMVSYIGYKQKAVPIMGRNTINIKLAAKVVSGKQLVVIGYGSQQKQNLTGSISQVSSQNLQDKPVARIDEALVGQMAGVQVRQVSGQPGAALQIQVRGEASINASNQPLYVVDGVPVDNITNLNPNDIASLEVLKDAASTAIYGSRGSNGVVIITTKQGRKGQTRFSFNAYYGTQQLNRKIDLLSPKGWENLQTQLVDSAWVQRGRRLGLDYKASDPVSYREQQLGGINPGYMPDPRWKYGTDSLTYVDWQNAFYRIAPIQNYQLSASGGTDNLRYMVSGNYFNQDGIAIGTNFKRFSTRANLTAQLSKAVRLNLELAPSLSWQGGGNVDGKDRESHHVLALAPVTDKGVGIYTACCGNNRYAWAGSPTSPVAYQMYSTNMQERQELYSKMDLNAALYRTLNLEVTGSWHNDGTQHKEYYPTEIAHGNWAGQHAPGSLSSGSYSTGNSNHYLFQTLLTWNPTFGKNNINAVAGYSLEYLKDNGSYQNDNQFANDLLTTINNSTSNVRYSSTSESEESLESIFGRVNYNYNEKYLASVSIRRDGSSRFGSANKWGYFPAFSLGWRLDQEAFLKSLDWLNTMKLRYSWGEDGNNSIPNYAPYGALGVYNYSFGGNLAVGYGPSSLSNPDLGWEKTRESDYGLDLGMFNDRIQLTADYYHKITSNLLLQVPTALSTGYSSGWENIGKVQNTGLEFDLNTKPIVRQLIWTSSFNISFNHNKVLQLGPGNAPIYAGFGGHTEIIQVGHPLYDFYMYDAIGVYMNQQDLNNSPHMSTNIPGDVKYKDVNGDGKITTADRTFMGHRYPTFNWGFNNSFTWKHFDFSFLIQGQGGNKIYSILGRAIDRPGMGRTTEALGRWRNRWRSPSNPGDGHTPSIFGTTGHLYDSRWLYDATYWRIKSITLGYTLPHNIIPELRSARIYIEAQNLFTHDHYYGGYNPDATNSYGEDYGSYGLARTFTAGISLGL